MKLADFRDKLDTFIQDWTSEQANGEIKMQSHNCDITSLTAASIPRFTCVAFVDAYAVASNACDAIECASTVDRKSTRLNSSHSAKSRMPSSA